MQTALEAYRRNKVDAMRLIGFPGLKDFPGSLAIPSFFEIKESNGVRKLSEKNRILFFRSLR